MVRPLQWLQTRVISTLYLNDMLESGRADILREVSCYSDIDIHNSIYIIVN